MDMTTLQINLAYLEFWMLCLDHQDLVYSYWALQGQDQQYLQCANEGLSQPICVVGHTLFQVYGHFDWSYFFQRVVVLQHALGRESSTFLVIHPKLRALHSQHCHIKVHTDI